VCTEMLTNQGWSPLNTIEATLVFIRANLIESGARLDKRNRSDYDEAEADVQENEWWWSTVGNTENKQLLRIIPPESPSISHNGKKHSMTTTS